MSTNQTLMNITRTCHVRRDEACRRPAPRGSRIESRLFAWTGTICVGLLLMAAVATAGPREQAKRIHDRLAGVPPSAATLDAMADAIARGNAMGAAEMAMADDAFYDITLKNWISPWTNEEQEVFVPLNDYTATVIGMIRDDVPFDTVLSADVLYTGAASYGLPAYSMTDNEHYLAIEERGLPLQAVLEQQRQSAVTALPPDGVAGVMTTRAAAEAYFVLGTNRAMLRFTLMNYLCRDLEQVQDTTRPPDRIRQDVSRSPGGDSRVYLNNCVSCHSGMDPLAGAFAYYDFDLDSQRIVYTPGQVQPKYSLNEATFAPGYVTTDDSWHNYWREGVNSTLGWDPNLAGSGYGAASMGRELARSQEFASCQVRKVFRNVCLRDPVDGTDRARVDAMVGSFVAGGYRMKQVFAESAVYCMGE